MRVITFFNRDIEVIIQKARERWKDYDEDFEILVLSNGIHLPWEEEKPFLSMKDVSLKIHQRGICGGDVVIINGVPNADALVNVLRCSATDETWPEVYEYGTLNVLRRIT